MRFAAVALALLAATPAAAQRVNTQIDDVRPIPGGGYTCRSAHYPELLLVETENPTGSISYAAKQQTPFSDLRLTVVYSPAEGRRHGVKAEVTGFHLRTIDFPGRVVAEARLSLDEAPDPAQLHLASDGFNPPTFLLSVDDAQREPLAARLDRAERARLDLLDDRKGVIASFNWDVSRHRYTAEMFQLWHWSCLRHVK